MVPPWRIMLVSSVIANSPTITGTKLMPSSRYTKPTVQRSDPRIESIPIKLIAIPSAPIANPLMVELSAATETTVRPRMASAKYSAGLNASAAFATGPEANIRMSTPAIAAAMERAGRQPHGDLRIALLRHGIAVIGGGGGGCFAWNIEQNGGNRSAEGGADRNGRQHQKRGQRIHGERERDQDRHGHRAAESGQDADPQPDHRAQHHEQE